MVNLKIMIIHCYFKTFEELRLALVQLKLYFILNSKYLLWHHISPGSSIKLYQKYGQAL